MQIKMLHSLSKDVQRGLKNSLYLTVANIVTTLITLVGFVYIPNRLGAHDYGIYTLALSFVALFHIFGFGGLSKVVIRESILNRSELERMLNRLFNFKLLVALLQIVTIIVVALLIPNYDQEILMVIILASHVMLFRGLKLIPSSILQAHEKIETLAKINVTHSLLRVFGIVGILFVVNDLMLIMYYMTFINLLFIYIYYRSMRTVMEYKFSINLKQSTILMKFFKQGMVFTLLAIGGVLSTKIDLFMLSLMSSIEDVAIYGLSEKIIAQFEMLRGAILTAFYPIVIKHFKSKKIQLKTLYLISGAIFGVSLLLTLVYALFAHDIISFLYHDAYAQTIDVSIVLAFYLVFFFANLPFSTAIQSVGLEKYILYMYPFSIALNVLLNYFLFDRMGVVGLAYSTLIVQAFMLAFITLMGHYQLKQKGFTQ